MPSGFCPEDANAIGLRCLGKTRMNMVEQIRCDGHEIVAFDINNAKNPKLE
jgi:6-phosphogluconate dehydrogenase (decarboxylating)